MEEYSSLLPAEATAPAVQEFDKSMLDCQVDENGKPWFRLNDIAKVLEMSDQSVRMMKSRGWFDEDETRMSQIVTPSGKQETTYVSESALYRILNRSNSPKARPFERWVTKEVLPSIRSTGAYMTPATAAQVVDDPFYAVKLAEKTLAQYTQAINAWKQAVENLEAEKQMHQNTKEHLALTEQQRDEAIRTKACISDKKTATAMATASAAVRKTASLENKLGEGATWKTVAAIPWLNDVFHVKDALTKSIGRELSQLSKRFGYPVKDAPDARWGSVHRYHIDIINHFYDMLMNDASLYRSYRRK